MTVRVFCELWTVNDERRMHWSRHGDLTKAARWAGKIAAKERKTPKMQRPVRVVVQPMQKPGVLADTGGHYPPAKAAIDGLVDAGVLANDTGEYVTAIEMRPPVKTKARAEGLVIYLTIAEATPVVSAPDRSERRPADGDETG